MDISSEYNVLSKLIHENEIISFDVYDTALLRNVISPTDIFDIVQRELYESGIELKGFKQIRLKAEEKARALSEFEDINLEEIYHFISERIGVGLSERVKRIELLVEKKFTTCNKFIKRLYDEAIFKKKRVLFISDMYLSKDFISGLLRNNGFDHSHELFVSGETRLSKASSKMYDFIKNKIGDYSSWIHIGDNRKSDYENAIKSGINSYYYKALRERVHLEADYSIEYSIMKAIQVNYCETTDNLSYWKRFGINVISSLLFGFTSWIVDEMKGKDNVYFLSRDGYLPYKLYKKITQHIKERPEPRYLYASRKAYQIPNILNMNTDEAIELLIYSNESIGQKKSIREIFDDIGLDREKYEELLGKYDLNNKEFLNGKHDRIKMKKFLGSIYPDVLCRLKQEKELLEDYLRENKVYEYKEINVVDVGWRGSIQKSLSDITKIKTSGYYLGTSYNVYDEIKSDVHGYSFNLGKPIQTMQRIMDNVMMYEFSFSAPHGSLKCFSKAEDSNDVVPLLSNNEQNLYEIHEQIYSGVLMISDRYIDFLKYLKHIKSEDSLVDYFTFIDKRRYEDLLHFKDLSISTGFGDTSIKSNFVTCTTIEEYLLNRKKTLREANKNLWKNAVIIKGSMQEFSKKDKPLRKKHRSLFTKDRIIKVIKDPKKAIKYIARYLK